MKTVPLSEIFNIEYGNQFDLNKLIIDLDNGINFISRSRENLGVQTQVKQVPNKKVFKKGSITVTLGGSYLLSSFVQREDFYTAQNIKVLTPKFKLNALEKKFYCHVIEFNRYRYTSHGREANKTLNNLLVPTIESIPKWVNHITVKTPKKKPLLNKALRLDTAQWRYFILKDWFDVFKDTIIDEMSNGEINLISAKSINNGVFKKIASQSYHPSNLITVSSNGSVGEAFYQGSRFRATGDINILKPKFKLNVYIALFLNTVIMKEKFRFNYGRKWGKDKILNHRIKLPVDSGGNPDWQFMEDYIKSLPYSAHL